MKVSAGILIYKLVNNAKHVLLVHPGGPHNSRRDVGAWSIPKGLVEEGEDLLQTAIREVQEELGVDLKATSLESYHYLGEAKQKNGKVVHAWAIELNLPDKFIPPSNTLEFEWPPHSGTKIIIPEVDQAEFFDLQTAATKINAAQTKFLANLP